MTLIALADRKKLRPMIVGQVSGRRSGLLRLARSAPSASWSRTPRPGPRTPGSPFIAEVGKGIIRDGHRTSFPGGEEMSETAKQARGWTTGCQRSSCPPSTTTCAGCASAASTSARFQALDFRDNRVVPSGGCVACGRCIAVCPASCIEIRPVPSAVPAPRQLVRADAGGPSMAQANSGGVLLSSCGTDDEHPSDIRRSAAGRGPGDQPFHRPAAGTGGDHDLPGRTAWQAGGVRREG